MTGPARLLWLAAVAFAGGVATAETPSYAVLSLIGNKFEVVTHRPGTGSNLDRNVHESVAMPDASFDKAALLAIDRAARRKLPDAKVFLLSATDPRLYELQEKLLERDEGIEGLLEPLKLILEGANADYLLLVTNFREVARLKGTNRSLGTGKLTGLGFYLDRSTPTRRSDTATASVGFIAPFAVIRISLIDARTMKVVREETAQASLIRSTARAADSKDPWDVDTPAQKAKLLSVVLGRGIDEMMPKVLGD